MQTNSITEGTIGSILQRLAADSARPRYAFLVLNLISEAASDGGVAGPFVRDGGMRTPIREWLCAQLLPMSGRDTRRARLRERLRSELADAGTQDDEARLDRAVEAHALAVGKTNVSRAVSDLVRAGLVRRHYAGWVKDHRNRGGGRHAVYTVEAEALAVLRRRERLL
jgi:hypothetical protein